MKLLKEAVIKGATEDEEERITAILFEPIRFQEGKKKHKGKVKVKMTLYITASPANEDYEMED